MLKVTPLELSSKDKIESRPVVTPRDKLRIPHLINHLLTVIEDGLNSYHPDELNESDLHCWKCLIFYVEDVIKDLRLKEYEDRLNHIQKLYHDLWDKLGWIRWEKNHPYGGSR